MGDYHYEVKTQFVNPEARFGKDEKKIIEKIVKEYNSKSLIAKNPKQITDYRISNDEMTLTIEIESESELPSPSKSLRVFSSLLVGNEVFKKHIVRKQLFKMSSEELKPEKKIVAFDIDDELNSNNGLGRLSKYLELLQKTDQASLDKIKKIDKILSDK